MQLRMVYDFSPDMFGYGGSNLWLPNSPALNFIIKWNLGICESEMYQTVKIFNWMCQCVLMEGNKIKMSRVLSIDFRKELAKEIWHCWKKHWKNAMRLKFMSEVRKADCIKYLSDIKGYNTALCSSHLVFTAMYMQW